MAELGLNWSPFKRGFDASKVYAEKSVSDLGANLSRRLLAPLSATALFAGTEEALRRTFNRAKELKAQSKLFDLGTDEIQLMDKAAHRVGLSFEDAQLTVEKFRNARKEAAEGNKDLRKSFEALGFSVAAIRDPLKKDGDLYLEVLQKAGQFNGAAQKAAVMDIYGTRSAYKVVALAREMQGMKLSPLAMSSEDIERLERFRIALERVAALGKGALGSLIAPEVGAWTDLIEGNYKKGYLKLISDGAYGPLATYGAFRQLDAMQARETAAGGIAGAAEGALNDPNEFRDKIAEGQAKAMKEAWAELEKAQESVAIHNAPDAKKIPLLQRRYAELGQQITKLDRSDDETDRLKAMKLRAEQVALTGEIQDIRTSAYKSVFRDLITSSSPEASYGAMMGASMMTAESQLDVLRTIANNTAPRDAIPPRR